MGESELGLGRNVGGFFALDKTIVRCRREDFKSTVNVHLKFNSNANVIDFSFRCQTICWANVLAHGPIDCVTIGDEGNRFYIA